MFSLKNKTILITGGTGSFGKKCAEHLLRRYSPKRLIIFSRDELKQHEMRVGGFDHPAMRYFIGDVRDVDRLRRAMVNVDVVIHAAALKQVPACEYNPIEAIQTNVNGGRNVIEAALDNRVHRVLALSTDKAVSPTNLYGATKLVAEKLFVQANAYRGGDPIRFSCVRYGNVVGSRGSVVPLFREQRKTGRITITDARMTRFWMTLDQAVELVLNSIETMYGGEVFIPKIPSMRVVDLAEVIAPDCEQVEIGIRPGEKLHETLISEDEARHSIELSTRYVITPMHPWWKDQEVAPGRPLPEGFQYSSNTNPQWLTQDQLRRLVGETDSQPETVSVES
ncbi:MAG TPA: UDP-N-acetylglucosamine 4,6-dehydratase (inverting) [Bryobacteraceae bacterium]|nr:UDP-N-acetylglucosamine 4,6-dehydratase (inverting) [Bryobacteraceae bacterium]